MSQTCELMKQNKNYKDLEDTLQCVLAKKLSCELIISNDKNFYSDEIRLMSSEIFCKEYIK